MLRPIALPRLSSVSLAVTAATRNRCSHIDYGTVTMRGIDLAGKTSYHQPSAFCQPTLGPGIQEERVPTLVSGKNRFRV